jgi:hypothetical protein
LTRNFPQPVGDALSDYMVEEELVAVAEIDGRLAELDDWEVLLALRHHEQDWDGLITTDSGMLSLPRELFVLLQTHLTLVVAHAAGHDPLDATGLVLTYLPWIAAHTQPTSRRCGSCEPGTNRVRIRRARASLVVAAPIASPVQID